MRNKIYYDMNKSEFSFDTENITYFFSSLLYLKKFVERYKKNREELQYRLSSRYNIEFDSNDYFDIILYNDIEKRGFKIICLKSGVKFECLNQVKLDGEIKMLKNLKE